ncbi:hypothetical protein BS47DRAFT_661306 [Hydnum rufescens UP504]|uniref:Uncharacterized protein n=1 Tax=Hydnum rufescens UP504 TaxID=1448309 RepID=A0A9P6AF27_9AGAM|nr:hypothetical protein BS47DRAFT_661306 [Hydnum rufescens UP504]
MEYCRCSKGEFSLLVLPWTDLGFTLYAWLFSHRACLYHESHPFTWVRICTTGCRHCDIEGPCSRHWSNLGHKLCGSGLMIASTPWLGGHSCKMAAAESLTNAAFV